MPVYRGAFHVHSAYSPDSEASLDFIIKVANKAGLDFVMITDHNNQDGRALYEKGAYPPRPLLLFGIEHSRYDATAEKNLTGHLISFGTDETPPGGLTNQALIDWVHEHGGYVVLAHPFSARTPWRDWDIRGIDGMEVYNFAHELFETNKFKLMVRSVRPPKAFLRASQKGIEKELKTWSGLFAAQGGVAAFGAGDAHLHWEWGAIRPESFSLYMQSATMYVWAEALEREKIETALGEGRCFLAFEAHGFVSGFLFAAKQDQNLFLPGSKLTFERQQPITFRIQVGGQSPRDSPRSNVRIRLKRNGKLIRAEKGTALDVPAPGPGVYHAEIYRGNNLWILASPIEILEKMKNEA
jgi:predicted metal-dependent phosphoesterase TrpH